MLKNATCEISHMPIFEGDPIIVLPLKKRKKATPLTHITKINSNWRILTMPFEAEYDGEGGIRNAKITDFDKKYWEQFIGPEIPVQAFDGGGYFSEVEKTRLIVKNSNSFESFFNKLFCENYFENYTVLMIHLPLYNDLMNNINKRLSPERDITYRKYWLGRINKAIEELQEGIDKYFIHEEDIEEKLRAFFKINTISQFSHLILHSFAERISPFDTRTLTPPKEPIEQDYDKFVKKMNNNYRFYVCNYFVQSLINGTEIEDYILDKVVDANILPTVMEMLNVGYMGTLHLHQNCEMKLQHVVAQFINRYINEYVTKQIASGQTVGKTRDDYMMAQLDFNKDIK